MPTDNIGKESESLANYRFTPRAKPAGVRRNAAERVEEEQIGVPGHDEIGMTINSQLQKSVVLGVAAGNDPLCDRYQLSRRQNIFEPHKEVLVDQWRQARPRQSDEEFLLGRSGFQKGGYAGTDTNGQRAIISPIERGEPIWPAPSSPNKSAR